MQSHDKPVNGQPINGQNDPSFLDLLSQTPPPPDEENRPRSAQRLAGLREAWDASWKQGGLLYERWEDVRHAHFAGWHGMANWIKEALSLASVCAFIIALDAAGDIVSAVAHQIASATPQTQAASETSNRFWAVIDTPVRSYIAQHSAGLAVSGSAVYAFWHAVGLFGLIGGFFHSTGARITYSLWAMASVAMVWSASPADSRTVATGIAVLAWTITSVLALRGLSLRPVIHMAFQPHIDIRPEVHVPPQPAPVHDDLDDEPGNIQPLQR
ncbi:hypothetical protein [Streptomyces galbus]|uniref:Uncharacterized protein n=1 Tax=Streptomyces galbus TaxID=33898 RepID=A0A4U5W3P5_STRGB|nr:hypothetical protein [Streptomyces galbus]TKS96046.1 hypothetical protein E4U92_34835 [Streptomyces galbus]GHD52242.1 hypothetical protein GCM10010335_64460 [Streptomyces galbus]